MHIDGWFRPSLCRILVLSSEKSFLRLARGSSVRFPPPSSSVVIAHQRHDAHAPCVCRSLPSNVPRLQRERAAVARLLRIVLDRHDVQPRRVRRRRHAATPADDAEEAVDGMNLFAELIHVLLIIHEKRPHWDSGEKLERVAGAGRGVMSDVQLVAKH